MKKKNQQQTKWVACLNHICRGGAKKGALGDNEIVDVGLKILQWAYDPDVI